MVWIVQELAADHFLRRYRCSLPNPDDLYLGTEGVDALTGTPVQTFHQALRQIGLPYRVMMRVTGVTTKEQGPPLELDPEAFRDFPFSIPSFFVNPAQVHSVASWPAFLQQLRSRVQLIAEELPQQDASPWHWVGIRKIEITYVPLDNLAAFQPHLEELEGGHALLVLPEALLNKHCVVNILNEDEQCLRCCLMLWELREKGKVKDPNKWSRFLSNWPRNGKRSEHWELQYKKSGLDLSMLSNRQAKLSDLRDIR